MIIIIVAVIIIAVSFISVVIVTVFITRNVDFFLTAFDLRLRTAADAQNHGPDNSAR